MLKSNLHLALLAAFLCGASAFAQQETPLTTKSEDQWLAVLGSDAKQKDKADACRELAVVGTQKSVAPLIALLADEKYNHMARYALETIPDPSVNDALRESLAKLNGLPLVGVIGSLGVRHDANSDKPIAAFLDNANPDVAQAAARALGRLATPAATDALKAAVAKAAPGNQLAVCEGLLRIADTLRANKKNKEAAELYDALRAGPVTAQQVRVAALRGAILARQKDGVPILVEAIRGEDAILIAAAARAAIELPDVEVSTALANELAKLSSVDRKVLVLGTLAKRGDLEVLKTVLEMTKAGDKTVRIAAIKAIPQFRKAAGADKNLATARLGDLVVDPEAEVAKAALESMTALPGTDVDGFVLNLLASDNAAKRIASAQLINRRRMTAAMPTLLKAASDTDAGVRSAALRNAGELAGAGDLSVMLDLLASAQNADQLEAISQALISACSRIASPDACADTLISRAGTLSVSQQAAVLRILGRVGGAKALKNVSDALANSNADIHAASLRSLVGWDNADAAPALLYVIKSASAPDRAVAFDGYLRLCSESDASADQRFKLISELAPLASELAEKKHLLNELGGVHNVPALQLTAKYLAESQLADDAGAAAVKISAKLDAGKKADVAPVLKEVAKTAKAQSVLDDAHKLMQKLGIQAE